MEDQHVLDSGPSINDHLRISGTAVDRGQQLLEALQLSGVQRRPSPPGQRPGGVMVDGASLTGAGTDPTATSQERIAAQHVEVPSCTYVAPQ